MDVSVWHVRPFVLLCTMEGMRGGEARQGRARRI